MEETDDLRCPHMPSPLGEKTPTKLIRSAICYHKVTKNRGKERKTTLRVGGLSFLSSIAYLSNLMGGSLFLLPDGTPYHVDSMLFPCLPYVKTAQQATTSVVFEQGMREVIGMKRAFPDIM